MEGKVLVPVSWEHIPQIRALLERLTTEDSTASALESADSTDWTRDELREIYENCSAAARRILLELASHPDDWVYGTELVKVADPTGKNKNIGSYLGSLTATAKRLGRPSEWPVDVVKDEQRRLFRYRMHRSVAKIILGFSEHAKSGSNAEKDKA